MDREDIQLPEDLEFPRFVPDYLTWQEAGGHRVYVVFKAFADRPPLGIVFRRNQEAGAASSMCEWCHSIRAGSSVTLLTARASGKRVVGIHLCSDLSCREKALAAPGVGRERVRRIVQSMSEFALRNLF
jgi:hypothetical protein